MALPLVVLTGQLPAGKSTVAVALSERYPRGYHVEIDALREMVTAGRASPLEWTAETTRQFDLAVRAEDFDTGVLEGTIGRLDADLRAGAVLDLLPLDARPGPPR